MKTAQKDFYLELDTALKSYEEYKPWHPMSMEKITDKIVWCLRWKKISKEQMEELADRATKIYENDLMDIY
jgi:hypothetical protein